MALKRKRDDDEIPGLGEQAPDPKVPKEERPIEEVHLEMAELFQEGDFWKRFRLSLHPSARKMAMATVDIMDLLKEYPALAQHRFHDTNSADHGPLYPLELFAYNWFGKRLLDRVHSLYPPAASELMVFVTRLRQVHSEETLLWIVKNCEGNTSGCPLQALLENLRSTGYREKLSAELIQAFIEINPNHAIPISDLFQDGYCVETLMQVVGLHAQREGSIELKGTWELTQMHARVITRVLPKLKEVTLLQSTYAIDGWIAIVEGLQACQNLETVNLHLTPYRLSSEPNGIRVLKSYLQDKPLRTELYLHLFGMCKEGEDNSITIERNRLFFAELLEGRVKRQSKPPVIFGLRLEDFYDLPATQMQHLADMCTMLRMMHIKIASAATNSTDIGIGKGIDGFTPSLWRSLCEVSKGDMYFAPPHTIDLGLDWSIPGPRDVTDLVVQLLECPSFQEIHIEQAGVQARHFLDFDCICKLLANNRTLNTLTLRTIEFKHGNRQSIPTMLLQLLNEQNMALSSLEVNNISKLYTLQVPKIKKREGERAKPCRHVDLESAVKIQYLLQLNSCGRASLRSKTATVRDVLNALGRAKAHAEEKLVPIIDVMATDLNASDLEQVNTSFARLMFTVDQWSKAPLHQHATDTQSLLYGLLRDTPGLWVR